MIDVIKGSDNQTDIEQLFDYINGHVLLNGINKKELLKHKDLVLRYMENNILYLERYATINLYQELETDIIKRNLVSSIKWEIKRIIKRMTSWYMESMKCQQNQFNRQVIMTLNNQLDIMKVLFDIYESK